MRVRRTSTVRWRYGPCCSDLPATSMLVRAPYCCPTLWGLLPSTCAPFVFGFPLFSIVSTIPMSNGSTFKYDRLSFAPGMFRQRNTMILVIT